MNVRPTRLSAGVVVVRREGDDWRYLLLRAAEECPGAGPRPPCCGSGCWSCPFALQRLDLRPPPGALSPSLAALTDARAWLADQPPAPNPNPEMP